MASTSDLRMEIWHCIRLWMFDYYFSDSYPYSPASKYGFTPIVFHALTHWKGWMSAKSNPKKTALRAHYEPTKRNDKENGGNLITLHIAPDGGEREKTDYVLVRPGSPQEDVLCAVESEWGSKLIHLEEDFVKLLRVNSPLKVMVFSGEREDFPEKVAAMEAMISGHQLYQSKNGQPNEDWLFIGIPYYYNGWPKRKEVAHVQLLTLSTPCNLPPRLSSPVWETWGDAGYMDTWMRAQYLAELTTAD